ncbi:MAG TPA: methylthioribulose 1-phosphate dehydratase [Saprospiraceae bacterium]|nr:methylthioribulose 1-phosphate dehydratase [Saprospiraceae bacterium]HMP25390.1 methylthioribulose 1-phosphate dehydratase [Saprospiraceae bacterium]
MENAVVQKEALVDVIRFLHAQGWAPATSSNYSFRMPSEANFYISESGIDKGAFAIENFLYVTASGQPIDDARRPSAETGLHSIIYALYPEVHCVLHTHSVPGTVLSRQLLSQGALFLSDYEILKGFSGVSTHEVVIKIPIFANTQDIPALAAAVQHYAQAEEMRAFLIAGHGMYTWGSTIAEAKRHVEVVEFLLACERRG